MPGISLARELSSREGFARRLRTRLSARSLLGFVRSSFAQSSFARRRYQLRAKASRVAFACGGHWPHKTSPSRTGCSGILPTSGYSPKWLAELVFLLNLHNALSDPPTASCVMFAYCSAISPPSNIRFGRDDGPYDRSSDLHCCEILASFLHRGHPLFRS